MREKIYCFLSQQRYTCVHLIKDYARRQATLRHLKTKKKTKRDFLLARLTVYTSIYNLLPSFTLLFVVEGSITGHVRRHTEKILKLLSLCLSFSRFFSRFAIINHSATFLRKLPSIAKGIFCEDDRGCNFRAHGRSNANTRKRFSLTRLFSRAWCQRETMLYSRVIVGVMELSSAIFFLSTSSPGEDHSPLFCKNVTRRGLPTNWSHKSRDDFLCSRLYSRKENRHAGFKFIYFAFPTIADLNV